MIPAFAVGLSFSFEIRPSNIDSPSGKLFDGEQLPCGLCFLVKNKFAPAKRAFCDRCNQTLFTESHSFETLHHTRLLELLNCELSQEGIDGTPGNP